MAFDLNIAALGFLLALTPAERWRAAGEPFDRSLITETWFILTILAVLIALTAVFALVSWRKKQQGNKVSDQLFLDYAQRRGLSPREHQILVTVANLAGLRQINAVFTTQDAFDRGTGKMIEQSLVEQQAEEAEQLRMELSFLREKLGFQKKPRASVGSSAKTGKLSSRNIPIGRKVHMTRRKSRDSADIEATVTENTDMELVVKSSVPVKVTFGDLWQVRYSFGAAIWEFDTTVVSCEVDILVLNHCDNVRFINRRRFLRVPVRKTAFVARFPFHSMLSAPGAAENRNAKADHASKNLSAGSCGPPEFVPAVVTELAGPGLRIDVPFQVNIGERVLVVFNLNNEENHGPDSRLGKTKAEQEKIIQDIGEVRHASPAEDGFSIAVELTGLSEPDLNELIRATNAASVKAGGQSQEISEPLVQEETKQPVTVQGA